MVLEHQQWILWFIRFGCARGVLHLVYFLGSTLVKFEDEHLFLAIFLDLRWSLRLGDSFWNEQFFLAKIGLVLRNLMFKCVLIQEIQPRKTLEMLWVHNKPKQYRGAVCCLFLMVLWHHRMVSWLYCLRRIFVVLSCDIMKLS